MFRLPACLPAIRLTNGRRIGPVFSHNTEYRCVNTDLLLRLRFIHCAMASPFILHSFPFSLTGEQKGEKSLKKCWWIVQLILINGQMHVCWLHHLLKLLPSALLPCTDSSQPGWFYAKILMRAAFLGCDLSIELLYEICNILCLNK